MRISIEEELFHLINTNGTGFEDYLDKVKGISNINFTDQLLNRSYLHVAIQNNREDIIKDLLERGIDVNIQDKNKNTAASYLAANKNWNLIIELISHGLNPNIKQRLGNTILWNVVFSTMPGDREAHQVVNALLNAGADPTSENIRGNTPLSLAMSKDEVITKMFEKLIKLKGNN